MSLCHYQRGIKMTDLEKELLEDSNNIYKKLLEIEEAELEGSSSIHKAALTREFFWEKSYKVNVSSQPSYERGGSLQVDSLKEALDYKEGECDVPSYDVEWDDDADDCFIDINVDGIEVSIDDFKLKNPSKECQEAIDSKKNSHKRKAILITLTRFLKESGCHPDDFHLLIDEVIDENEEFKSKFNYGR